MFCFERAISLIILASEQTGNRTWLELFFDDESTHNRRKDKAQEKNRAQISKERNLEAK